MNIYQFLEKNKDFFQYIWNIVKDSDKKNIINTFGFDKKYFKNSFEELIFVQPYSDHYDIEISKESLGEIAIDVKVSFNNYGKVDSCSIDVYETDCYFRLFVVVMSDSKFEVICTSYLIHNCDFDCIDDEENLIINLNDSIDVMEGSLSFPKNPDIKILDLVDDTLVKRKVVYVDMDYTLCNPKHRECDLPHKVDGYKFMDKSSKSLLWKRYFEGCFYDDPIIEVIELVKLLQMSSDIVILTARDYSSYDETIRWLEKYNIEFTDIKMRIIGDERPANEIKLEYLNNSNHNKEDILILDDDNRNVSLMREHGYKVLSPNIQHLL